MEKSIWPLTVAGCVLLAACGEERNEQRTNATDASAPAEVASPSPSRPTVAATTPYPVEACKAAIATIMGRNPSTMKGRKIEGGLIHVSYIRPDDGKRWQARCRINDANHLSWAQFDAFGDGQQGRWRDEDNIEFEVKGKSIHVRNSEGGELISEETYPLAKLK